MDVNELWKAMFIAKAVRGEPGDRMAHDGCVHWRHAQGCGVSGVRVMLNPYFCQLERLKECWHRETKADVEFKERESDYFQHFPSDPWAEKLWDRVDFDRLSRLAFHRNGINIMSPVLGDDDTEPNIPASAVYFRHMSNLWRWFNEGPWGTLWRDDFPYCSPRRATDPNGTVHLVKDWIRGDQLTTICDRHFRYTPKGKFTIPRCYLSDNNKPHLEVTCHVCSPHVPDYESYPSRPRITVSEEEIARYEVRCLWYWFDKGYVERDVLRRIGS